MSHFIIDVPMPSMGATVSELTILNINVTPGTKVAKGQKLAELESDKSAFDFEAPADGTITEVNGVKGDVKSSGQSLFRMETADASLKHLEVAGAKPTVVSSAAPSAVPSSANAASALVWTPRAIKMAQEAGLNHATITDIQATGPGGRVSGDDVTHYLSARK
ncbi:biotin/lipoyl-containing protein [Oleiharenicola lentus]|uniref:biotin/lipoyl-containing protein n=1 Tax=Oleiharenicola lentus TaxID=2508720 RepID=UPI003F677906